MSVRVEAALVLLALLFPVAARAQEPPARRLSNIVGVAVEEYRKGIDERGQLISELEYAEAVTFLRDARRVAERLSGERAPLARIYVDSLEQAVARRRSPSELDALHERFVVALGNEGTLELPGDHLDVAEGRALYVKNCATCHGDRGAGDGPAGASLGMPVPAIGSREEMRDRTPALLYRVISVGIGGTPMAGFAGRLTSRERWNIVAYLHSLRTSRGDVLEGEGLYLQQCSSCHGAEATGVGEVARALTRLPPEIGGIAWQVERSDAQLAAAIRRGVSGTAMPPALALDEAATNKIVAYLRALAFRQSGAGKVASSPDTTASAVARTVLSTLDQAIAAAQGGRSDDASDRAFDAYIAFEPLETPARAKNPGLVANMERHFAEFRGALAAGDLRAAGRARDAIEARLPSVVELTGRPSSAWGAFFQSLLIILREGLEAILVIGAVATFLIKTGHRERLRSIWIGAGLALAASGATAVILQTSLRAMPASREIIEGVTMLVAVAVLFSVSFWLISKVEAAKWQRFIREKVSAALERGGGKALALVAFLAVYREGAETALFYQALFREGGNVGLPIAFGIFAGFAALAIIFLLFYRFGVRIPLRPFFAVTSVLLYYLAFVFMGKGVRELQEGNLIPITLIPGMPNIESMGIYASVETLVAQMLLVLLFLFAVVKTFWPRRALPLASTPAAPLPSSTSPDVTEQLSRLEETAARLEARLLALEYPRTPRPEGGGVGPETG